MKNILLLVIAVGLSACGSLNTLVNSDQEISDDLKRQNTYCESMPRIYSGVAYDFCFLHSNPGRIYVDWFLGFYLVDGVASAVVDTVLLPYTGYKQYKYGNLDIH